MVWTARVAASASGAVVLLLTLVGVAHAQSSALTRGVERFDEADFSGAIAAFDEAEAGDGLNRADLVDLYVRRASAHLAVGDREAMQRDLRRLASLDPTHAFGPETRPEVRQAFESVREGREAVAVDVGHEARPGALRLVGTVVHDPEDLTRRVEIYGRTRGGAWMNSDDGALVVPAVEGAVVEHYVLVIGPGGATIASAGSEDAPLVVRHDGTLVDDSTSGPPITDDGGGDNTAVFVIGGVVVVALVVGAILLIALSGSNDATQPDPPMIFPSM